MTSFDVFLSHNSKDKPVVRELADALQARGLKVWLDEWELVPGRPWQQALEESIETTKAAAVLVGGDGLGPWEDREMRAFLSEFVDRKLPVIPVVLPNAPDKPKLPLFLRQFTWVDLRAGGLTDEALDRLIWGVTGIKPDSERPKSPAADKLQATRNLVKQLTKEGADQAAIDAAKARVLEARREIREGGRLRADDVLSDRYALLECVGSGGFATVWKCFDEQTMQVVAAKILHPSHREERTRIDRFFRGARAMKQLSHQNIVRVLDERCSDEGFHFYIMEFIDGDDFHEAILSERISRDAVLDIILAAADALHHAHTTLPDLVHRDVKPSNILLTSDGQVCVTDFDLVRTADTTGGTRTGSLGTFMYTAPESLQKAGEVNARADVFSLGMTAVFGLYGQELPVTAFRHTSEFIDSLDCGEGIKHALKRAVEWESSERFASMREFAESIRAALQDESSVSNSTSPTRKAAKRSNSKTAKKSPRKAKSRRTSPEASSGDLATNSIGMQLKLIPAGEFMMGAKPQHRVRITKPFYLSVCTVTQEQYAKVMEVRPWQGQSYVQEGPDNPAVYVNWNQAVEFCRKLSEQEGVEYRLPTEAQWEYACRAGSETTFSFGDDVSKLGEYAWYRANAWDSGEQYAHAVGQKLPNPWRLYDMHGNVWEWCWDRYGEYGDSEVTDPSGPASGDSRVLRGGSFNYVTDFCRSAIRNLRRPDGRDLYCGFRVSRTYS